MSVLVLNDEKSENFEGLNLPKRVREIASSAGLAVKSLTVRAQAIEPCVACASCWLKSPGTCIFKSDGVEGIDRAFIKADTIVFVSGIVYGCWGPDLKRYIDRLTPQLLPYLTVRNGKMGHNRRYPNPTRLVALGWSKGLNEEEARTFAELVEGCGRQLSMEPLALTAQNTEQAEAALVRLSGLFSEEVFA